MNFTACDHHVQNVVSRKVFNLESMTGFTESMASGVHVCVRIHVCMLCVPVCAHVRVCMCAGICSCVCVCVCEYMPVHFWELVSALQSHCQRHTDPNAQITDEETEVQGGPERVQVPRCLCPGLIPVPPEVFLSHRSPCVTRRGGILLCLPAETCVLPAPP